MVLGAQHYPSNGGYQGYAPSESHGYGHDFYSKNEHDYNKEEHYSEDGYYESGSSMQMTRPNISTSQPIKHFVVSPHHEGYNSHQESGFGKHQNYYGNNSIGQGYPQRHGLSGVGGHGLGGLGGYGLGGLGSGSHSYAKPSSGMHYGGYESHHESHMQIGPGRSGSSMNNDYYGHGGRDRYSSYYDQQQQQQQEQQHNNCGGKSADQWTSKCL